MLDKTAEINLIHSFKLISKRLFTNEYNMHMKLLMYIKCFIKQYLFCFLYNTTYITMILAVNSTIDMVTSQHKLVGNFFTADN